MPIQRAVIVGPDNVTPSEAFERKAITVNCALVLCACLYSASMDTHMWFPNTLKDLSMAALAMLVWAILWVLWFKKITINPCQKSKQSKKQITLCKHKKE